MFQQPHSEVLAFSGSGRVPVVETVAYARVSLDEEAALIAHYFSVEKMCAGLRHEALTRWIDSGLAETIGFYAFLAGDAPAQASVLPTLKYAA